MQREHRLNEHLRNLRDAASLIEELLAWLATCENTLTTLDAEPLPEELPVIEVMIKDHQEFMEDMAKRTPEVDRVCKTKQAPRANQPSKDRKPSAQASRNKSTISCVTTHYLIFTIPCIYIQFVGFDSAPDRDFSQSPTRESSPEHDVPLRRGR